jgi:hypothetical protein
MSWPPSGRDTHHETRVMRDDVMCHGTMVSRGLEILDVPGLDQKAASKYWNFAELVSYRCLQMY